MRSHLTIRFLLLIFVVVLTGCGQKGPLYLPPEPEQAPEQSPDQLPEQSPETDNSESPES
jgi:predicted small lipoprotein YifL